MGKKYAGKWVALKQDRKTVIAAGKSAMAVHSEAIQYGYRRPIITHIPRSIHVFVGILV